MGSVLSLVVFAICVSTFQTGFSAFSLSRQILEIVVFIPLILLYTGWVYRVMRGRVTLEHVRKSHNLY